MVWLQSLHSVGVVTISFHIFCYALSGLFSLPAFFSSIGLQPVCCMYYSLLTSILHMILHGFLFVFCVLFPFFVLILHGVCVVGIMGFVRWGVLFCCLCTTTPLYIPYGPYNVYSYLFFCHVLYACFFFHIYPWFFLLFQLCMFCPCLDENFWGVCAYASYAAIYVFGNMHA